MTDRENVIKGLEQFKADLKPFCGNRADWERFDAGFALLKEQQEQIDRLIEENASNAEMAEGYAELLKRQENDIHHMGLIIEEYEKELKKKEAVEPTPPTDESDLWRCGNCNHQLFRCTHQRYCEMCGREVKWE